MPRILVIGGTSFMGLRLVWRLLAQDDDVTILTRGRTADPFANRVQRLVADRTTDALSQPLSPLEFDAAIDFSAFTADDVRRAVTALEGRVGHYVFISSGASYLTRLGAEIPVTHPLTEGEWFGPLSQPPDSPEDRPSWQYGSDKRRAEEVLIEAFQTRGFPSTRIRLPNVNGERDPTRRLESYLWRLLDGGPVLMPDGGDAVMRHVYSADVVNALASLAGNPRTLGKAYNFCQTEQPRLHEFLAVLAQLLGVPNRAVAVSSTVLKAAGLSERDVSPLTGRWTSRLDPGLAHRELGFFHRPMEHYLGSIVEAFYAHMPPHPPDNYATRPIERQLVTQGLS